MARHTVNRPGTSRRYRRMGLLLSSLMLGACGASTAENPPPGAVHVEDGLYMVPVGVDESGCQQYSGWSATKALPAVIYYRAADGTFTMLRSEADCGEET